MQSSQQKILLTTIHSIRCNVTFVNPHLKIIDYINTQISKRKIEIHMDIKIHNKL